MELNLDMTRGTKRILELARKHDPGIDQKLMAEVNEAMDESIEDHIFSEVGTVELPSAMLRFYVDASVDHAALKASYMTPILAIEYDSMSIMNVPETKRIQHLERANKGFPAREVVDIDLLDGVEVIRVVNATEPQDNAMTTTLYLLSHEWSQSVSLEGPLKCS